VKQTSFCNKTKRVSRLALNVFSTAL